MKRSTIISAIIIIIISFIFLLNINLIFQEGNPLPIFSGILQLNDSKTFAKIKNNPVTYITKTNNMDELFSHIEEDDKVRYREQMGSGYIFENENKIVILTSRQYTRNYQIWEYNKRDLREINT